MGAKSEFRLINSPCPKMHENCQAPCPSHRPWTKIVRMGMSQRNGWWGLVNGISMDAKSPLDKSQKSYFLKKVTLSIFGQKQWKKSPKIEIWHKWSIFCGVFTLQSGYFTGTAPYYYLLMLFWWYYIVFLWSGLRFWPKIEFLIWSTRLKDCIVAPNILS